MTKLKAIVVDDEKWARTVLSALLKRDFDTVEIVAECVDVLSAVEQIRIHKPDVVFLDIEMPNYAGYELVDFFESIDFKIIFVTAFDKYAIKAFQINAIDYLVKPIDRQKLKEAIAKLAVNLEKENKIEHYNELLKTIKNKNYKKIVLPELGNRRIVEMDNIVAIKADGTYSKMFFKADKPIVLSKTLKHFENLLEDNSCFFRSHRSWLINLKHIKSINKSENTIFMDANLETTISRSKFSEFEQAIKQH